MRKRRSNAGFSMAEVLVVVAIVGVLSGVAFRAVAGHMRAMDQLERDAIAKEIFVAAQNHLTMADSQGYLANTGKGAEGDADADAAPASDPNALEIHYFTNADLGLDNLLDLMLPFGALDDAVRLSGSYIIRYQADPALVLDVFYSPSGGRFIPSSLEYKTLVDDYRGADKSENRQRYNGGVVGWYGDGDALPKGQNLQTPTIEVINAERLLVKVYNPNAALNGTEIADEVASLKLIISGEETDLNPTPAVAAFDLHASINNDRVTYDTTEKEYTVALDDITLAERHFAELAAGSYLTVSGDFLPGENIVVQAVAYSNKMLTNIAYSGEITTNSLFADLDEADNTALVNNIRHLENLDNNISQVNRALSDGTATPLNIASARQVADLSWEDFKTAINTPKVRIYSADNATCSANGMFMPLSPGYALTYDGCGFGISGVSAKGAGFPASEVTSVIDDATELSKTEGPAGLFGAPTAALTLSNLKLMDFSVIGVDGTDAEGNAGALAGALADGSAISNVIAVNDPETDDRTAVTVSAEGAGSAGGLIGEAGKGSTVQKSAAALVVESAGGAAGGLIGKAAGEESHLVTVTGCYAGGHTADGAYDEYYNVTAGAGEAGGLIGTAENVDVTYSYSTCSVTGETAGGFAGTLTGSVGDCYAAGLVTGTGTETVGADTLTKDGAFAYELSGTASACSYFEIVNERLADPTDSDDAEHGYTYLPGLGAGVESDDIVPLDDMTDERYKDFFTGPDAWHAAVACDPKLAEYYNGKFNLQTVEQLGMTLVVDSDDETDYFVASHYGDWPAPELFVFNTK